jgi:hypothetical protein
MHSSLEPHRRQHRDSIRYQARLDAEMEAKLEALANTFHRKRAAILRYVMQWGLAQTTGWTIDPLIPDLPHLVHILVERDLVDGHDEYDTMVSPQVCWTSGRRDRWPRSDMSSR